MSADVCQAPLGTSSDPHGTRSPQVQGMLCLWLSLFIIQASVPLPLQLQTCHFNAARKTPCSLLALTRIRSTE